jgi:hypothetical protein
VIGKTVGGGVNVGHGVSVGRGVNGARDVGVALARPLASSEVSPNELHPEIMTTAAKNRISDRQF